MNEHMPNVVNTQKTASFQMRISPEVKARAEQVFSAQGLTLTDAVNIFLQQSLNAQGLPFLVSPENETYLKTQATARLMGEIEKGWASVTPEEDWISEGELYRRLGVEP